jgi:hypothetical protein
VLLLFLFFEKQNQNSQSPAKVYMNRSIGKDFHKVGNAEDEAYTKTDNRHKWCVEFLMSLAYQVYEGRCLACGAGLGNMISTLAEAIDTVVPTAGLKSDPKKEDARQPGTAPKSRLDEDAKKYCSSDLLHKGHVGLDSRMMEEVVGGAESTNRRSETKEVWAYHRASNRLFKDGKGLHVLGDDDARLGRPGVDYKVTFLTSAAKQGLTTVLPNQARVCPESVDVV